MAEGRMTAPKTRLERERICLDFANTADWHASGNPREQLHTYADLVSWSQNQRLLTDREVGQLTEEAACRPTDAAAVLERAIALREAIYRVFSAAAGGRFPAATDLALLNGALSEALRRLEVIRVAGTFAWGWAGDGGALDRMLWPVVRSAAELLTSEKLARVGQCADDRGCGFLFLDMSRNRSRRWCDMKDCGNRAKARRHYHRKHGSRGSPK
jgi:predicted RNA-binding Zn ribbon-like protein